MSDGDTCYGKKIRQVKEIGSLGVANLKRAMGINLTLKSNIKQTFDI